MKLGSRQPTFETVKNLKTQQGTPLKLKRKDHSDHSFYNEAYPTRKTSASFNRAVLIKIGNGYFSNKLGNRTIASHCSPVLLDRSPEVNKKIPCLNVMLILFKFYFHPLGLANDQKVISGLKTVTIAGTKTLIK